MIKFTPYFYKFKEMLLDERIPVEYRAMYLEDRTLSTSWRKRYNFNMYVEDSVDMNKYDYRGTFNLSMAYILKNATIKNIESIMDMDIKHPEISPSDLIVSLILWGRGVAIVSKILDINPTMPEHDAFKKIVMETKRWNKEKKSLPNKPNWVYR